MSDTIIDRFLDCARVVSPTELSGPEFERYYACGELPERFWPEEIAKLSDQFARDEISLDELEDALDDLMGLTNALAA